MQTSESIIDKKYYQIRNFRENVGEYIDSFHKNNTYFIWKRLLRNLKNFQTQIN